MPHGSGQNSKNQTVYDGPTIQTSEGTVYNGPVPGGAAYQGSAPTTAYSPSLQALRFSGSTVNAGARKGAAVFFWIAGVTAFRTLLLFLGVQHLTLGANRMVAGDMQSILAVNVGVIAIFVMLGIFTGRGSKMSLLIGMLLYGADTVLLLIGDASANAIYILVHVLFLYSLLKAYRQFAD